MAFDSTECAWRDMEVSFNGQSVGKIKRFKSTTSRETEFLHGAGDNAFDVNPGNKTTTGEAEVYKSVIDTMNRVAITAGFSDLTDVPWVVGVSYKATSNSPRTKVIYPGLRFDSFEEGGENNSKALTSALPWKSLDPVRQF